MADYREPKPTATTAANGGRNADRRSGTRWIAIAAAVLIVIALIWWLWPSDEPEITGVPVTPEAAEPVAPGAAGD